MRKVQDKLKAQGLTNYEQAIAEMARVCRHGGTVTLEYDNKWHLGLLYQFRELRNALTTRRRGDLRQWTYEYLNHDSKVNLTYKTFTFPEMQSLLNRHGPPRRGSPSSHTRSGSSRPSRSATSA